MRLKDAVVIMTGGAVGIGRVYARRLLSEGARVVVADVVDPLTAVRELESLGAVMGVRTDVTSREDVEALVTATVSRFGRVDVLVNNAALAAAIRLKPCDEIPESEWDRVMAVNVKGPWLCVRAVAPHMKRARRGKIINIASTLAFRGAPMMAHYIASKGAVVALTRALARELGEFGIAVNSIAPGLTLSDTMKTAPQTAGQTPMAVAGRSFKRDQTPEDLEGALVFLASSDSDFMTGQTLVVDGGSVFV
jgi:NAD(P)-dependent dehydrogenase (short-subunit alcohol dehydrogenase family)